MIQFDHLTFGYGQQTILNDLSLNWVNGRIIGLVGPNGSGKSTCLKLAAGLLTPREGQVQWDSKPLSLLKGRPLGRLVSYLPQSRPVPMISVRSLVSHGRFPHTGLGRKLTPADLEAVDQALSDTGLIDLADRDLKTLSGGQQQKAYLALLIAQNASHVLLDEPTTYLDIRHQLELFQLLKNFKAAGKCVVIVLHDLNQALSLCDEICLLHQGQLLYAGNPEGLIPSRAIETAFGVEPLMRPGLDFKPLA